MPVCVHPITCFPTIPTIKPKTAPSGGTQCRRILDAGFDDLWPKPISLDGILRRSADYLGVQSDGDADSSGLQPPDSDGYDDDPRLAAAVKEFAAGLPARLELIESSLRRADDEAAHEALHPLVGGGGIFGFMPVSEEAARLVGLLKENRLRDGSGELQPLRKLIDKITRTALNVNADQLSE